MSEQVPPPTLTVDRKDKDRRTGRLLVGSGVANVLQSVMIVFLLFVIAQVTGVNHALALALGQQRDQFIACTDKPASTRGCTTPIAAEPSVIAKEGSRGPIGLTGDVGARGPQGPAGPVGAVGPAGPAGPVGPPGAAGKPGSPPGCALLSTACVGASGPKGDTGATGATGDTGATGATGEKGDTGDPGAKGDTGDKGDTGSGGTPGADGYSIVDSDCVGDGVDSFWRLTLNNGTDQKTIDTKGPCRVGPEMP